MTLQEFLKQTETTWDKFTAPFYSIRKVHTKSLLQSSPTKTKVSISNVEDVGIL
jgi:hypothetical protein